MVSFCFRKFPSGCEFITKEFAMRILIKLYVVIAAMMLLSSFSAVAEVLLNDSFDRELDAGWQKASMSVIQMQGGAVHIETSSNDLGSRSFIYRSTGDGAASAASGDAAYNFFKHDIKITAAINSFDGQPALPDGISSFFIGISYDAVSGKMYGGPECGSGIFVALEKVRGSNGDFYQVLLRENQGGKTQKAISLGTLTTIPRQITLMLNKADWEVSIDGAKFTEWGDTNKRGVLACLKEADFQGFYLSVGVANLGPTKVSAPAAVGLDGLTVSTGKEDAALPVEKAVSTTSTILPKYAFEEYAIRTDKGVAVIYPHPDKISRSEDYRLFVSGKEVFCYADRQFNPSASKDEFNMPTSPQAYAIFDFSGAVDVEVEILNSNLLAKTKAFLVAPQSTGITPVQTGSRLKMRLDKPGYYVIDPDGRGYTALQILTAVPEVTVPDQKDPNVIYFGPGVYDIADPIVLKDNQTLYIAGGAVLRPLPTICRAGWENGKKEVHYSGRSYEKMVYPISADNVRNVTIKGRGVISAERGLPNGKRFGLIDIHHGENIRVEDITITHSSGWTLHYYCCSNSIIDGVRIMGWFTNCDGPAINTCNNTQIRNCFVHTADDGLELKTDKQGAGDHNILFENCVIWADVGTAMGVTHEITGPVDNVIWRNHTVLHFKYRITGEWDVPHRGAILVHPAFGGTVSNLKFENITIESQDTEQPAILIYNGKHNRNANIRYGQGTPYSKIENIVFSNIRVLNAGFGTPAVLVYDHSEGGENFKNIIFDHVGMVSADSGKLIPLPLSIRGKPEVQGLR